MLSKVFQHNGQITHAFSPVGFPPKPPCWLRWLPNSAENTVGQPENTEISQRARTGKSCILNGVNNLFRQISSIQVLPRQPNLAGLAGCSSSVVGSRRSLHIGNGYCFLNRRFIISTTQFFYGHHDIIRMRDKPCSLTLVRVGAIRLRGGNAWSSMFGSGCVMLSPHRGAFASDIRKTIGHWVFPCEAKRFAPHTLVLSSHRPR